MGQTSGSNFLVGMKYAETLPYIQGILSVKFQRQVEEKVKTLTCRPDPERPTVNPLSWDPVFQQYKWRELYSPPPPGSSWWISLFFLKHSHFSIGSREGGNSGSSTGMRWQNFSSFVHIMAPFLVGGCPSTISHAQKLDHSSGHCCKMPLSLRLTAKSVPPLSLISLL